jgi:thymidine kinase
MNSNETVPEQSINITGPMFSGKTTEFIRLIERDRIADKKCIIIKYEKDTRYNMEQCEEMVITHSGIKYDKCEIKYCSQLDQKLYLYLTTGEYKVVGIEEGQFFQNVDIFTEILSLWGIKVIITSLDGDYLQRPFENISRLNSKAKIIQIDAVCLDCKSSSGFYTVKTVKNNNIMTNANNSIDIGGAEKYKPVCGKCLKKYNSIENIIQRIYVDFKNLLCEIDQKFNHIFLGINCVNDINKNLDNIYNNYINYKNMFIIIVNDSPKFKSSIYEIVFNRLDLLITQLMMYRLALN